MNFCRPVQQFCNKLCPKETSIKYMAPASVNITKGLNKYEEENKTSNQENPKQSKDKKTSDSLEDSLYDNFPEFTIRRGSDNDKMSCTNRSSSSGSSCDNFLQRKQQRKGNSIFGPSNQLLLKKSNSFESNVKNKTPAPKKRSKPVNDPVQNHWANKGAMVYSAQTANPSKPKPNKYWVQTELQYIILLPMDKRKTKSPPELDQRKELLTNTQEKESFEDLDIFDSDDSFIPRSQAKPASKPKGRFCCAKRQSSSDV